jgi:hypothetical protein
MCPDLNRNCINICQRQKGLLTTVLASVLATEQERRYIR